MANVKDKAESVEIRETNKDANVHSSEKIRALRAAIDAKLHEQGIYDQIRDLVHLKARGDKDVQENDLDSKLVASEEDARLKEDELINEVLESEVVQQLLGTVRSMELPPTACELQNHNDDEDGGDFIELANERDVFLYLRLSGGKAFVDQLVEFDQDDAMDNGLDAKNCPIGSVLTFFRINATFQKQRQTSHDIRCCVDPPFDEHFRFRVEKKRDRRVQTPRGASYAVDVASPWEALCLVEELVQLDLIKVTKKLLSRDSANNTQWHELSRELVAVHRLDWRRVLCSTLQLVHFPIQLTGRMKEPVGSLDVRADLLHWKRSASTARGVRAFLNKEALRRNTKSHSFYKYAKQWWDEYRSETQDRKCQVPKEAAPSEEDEYSQLLTRIGSRQRLVKMFAEDEEGRYRLVCKFIVPLRVPTAVRSPSEAARFVSLLPYESTSLVGGGADETWRSIATVLSLCKGDAQDHAILLASLLLGCGLDAFVCIGTISASKSASQFARGTQRLYDDRGSAGSAEVGHVWVLTRGSSAMDVLLWEAVTGEKFAVNDARVPRRRGYCAIDCVFSNRHFFANLQPRALKLSESSFDFDDETCWKRMDEHLIADLPYAQPPTAILAPDVASALALEEEWTKTLTRMITSRRRAEGLVTRWSQDLSFYLLPALNSYELERLYGVPEVDNSFFQQSIANFVPEGYTFQGVPSMFTIESPDEALHAMTSNPLVVDVLALHAGSAQFALAVRCFPYAQSTVATWVMLADCLNVLEPTLFVSSSLCSTLRLSRLINAYIRSKASLQEFLSVLFSPSVCDRCIKLTHRVRHSLLGASSPLSAHSEDAQTQGSRQTSRVEEEDLMNT